MLIIKIDKNDAKKKLIIINEILFLIVSITNLLLKLANIKFQTKENYLLL